MPSHFARHLLALLPALALGLGNAGLRVTEPNPPKLGPVQSSPVQASPVQASPPRIPVPTYRPADPLYPQQWNLARIGMEGAWAVSRGAPVTVAVLDTGFANLPDLAGRVVNGYDFVSDAGKSGDGDGRDPDASDDGATAYHASMVAGIIGAAHDGKGLAGINPRARIVEIRVADDDGKIRVDDLVDALRWAAGLSVAGVARNPNPARVVNLSLFADFIPLTGCDSRVQSALDEVTARGVIVVAGAGNDGANAAGYTPAGCRKVITVTATGKSGERPSYANWGASVTLAAPGGNVGGGEILVQTPRGPARLTGTSFAAPHVSGVVSLMLGLNPALTFADVERLLRQSATPFAGGACDWRERFKTCGAGELNAAKTLLALRAELAGK